MCACLGRVAENNLAVLQLQLQDAGKKMQAKVGPQVKFQSSVALAAAGKLRSLPAGAKLDAAQLAEQLSEVLSHR